MNNTEPKTTEETEQEEQEEIERLLNKIYEETKDVEPSRLTSHDEYPTG